MGRVISRSFMRGDLSFVQQLAIDSPLWRKTELQIEHPDESNLHRYIVESEQRFGGQWLVWETEHHERFAITYHHACAPSNQKPWLGTILVEQSFQNQGLSRLVIDELAKKYKERQVMFTAVPEFCFSWLQFLSHVGFEQYTVEEDGKGTRYLLLIRPIEIKAD